MQRLRDIRGITLLESLVSIMILSIGLVGVVGCLTAALVAGRTASDVKLASAIAEDTIEDMRSRGFSAINYATFPQTSSVDNLHGGVRTIEITDDYGGNPRLKRVVVDVSWRTMNLSSSSVRMETLVTNRTHH